MRHIHYARRTLSSGFTLIELLVVSAIIVIVSGLILAQHNLFGGRVQLQNFAYDLALSVRQAQSYGIAVRRFSTATFNAGYGLHFDTTSPTTYVLFADLALPATGMYDPNHSPSELVQSNSITRGYVISQICVTPQSGSESCTPSIPTSLDVFFIRPEPDAWISNNSSCLLNRSLCAQQARIVIRSPQGDTMNVIIASNGQISVQ